MTRCSGRALCHWMRSKRRSMRGSHPNRPSASRSALGSLLGDGPFGRLLAALLERLVDQLLGAASEACRADRRTAVDAIPAIGFEGNRLVGPGFARLARPALPIALGNAKPLALWLSRTDHHFVVGRARAGIGAIDNDLADAAVLREGRDGCD